MFIRRIFVIYGFLNSLDKINRIYYIRGWGI